MLEHTRLLWHGMYVQIHNIILIVVSLGERKHLLVSDHAAPNWWICQEAVDSRLGFEADEDLG